MPTTWYLALAGGAMIGGAAALLLLSHGSMVAVASFMTTGAITAWIAGAVS